jgi:very-short-patch-repair endonuclease
MDPVEALRLLSGSADRAQLLRYCSRRALERAVARGEVQKVGKSGIALPSLPDPLKTAAGYRGVLSHASAAEYWLMESINRPAAVHLTLPRQAHRAPRPSIRLHYAETDDERVTSPLRTVLDCSRTMPFREALAIADSALRRELISPEQLIAGAEVLRGPGSRMARRVAGLADLQAANPFESALRATAIDSGVTGFTPQLFIPGLGYRVDLGDPLREIALEADSFTFHGTQSALERDCRRYDELVRHGWLVLRFAWQQVMFEEPWVASVIVDCCRLRPDRKGGTTGPGRSMKAKKTA